MASSELITGGCLCGAVRFEAGGDPELSVLCHCRMCQRASGAPVSALLFLHADRVTVTNGKTRAVEFSARTWRHVCDHCASPLFFTRDARPDLRAIFVGALDDPGGFRPEMHVCVSSAMSWLEIRDDAPRYDEKPPGMSQTVGYDPATGQTVIPD
ncbi:MAG TPA: GFA family protein [Rhodopila sp.]